MIDLGSSDKESEHSCDVREKHLGEDSFFQHQMSLNRDNDPYRKSLSDNPRNSIKVIDVEFVDKNDSPEEAEPSTI